jgi:DNA repair exonuclease SbcCD nuclease subunit
MTDERLAEIRKRVEAATADWMLYPDMMDLLNEVERLKRERDEVKAKLWEQVSHQSQQRLEAIKERDAAREECERLRKALNFIVNNASSWGLEAEEYVVRARQALQAKEGK